MKHTRFRSLAILLASSLAMIVTTPAFALGLGTAQVYSYLNQPLLVHIPLISQSGEELGTITAGFASAADIEMMGLARTISVPLHFEVFSDPGNSYIEVSSRLGISDPVVQVVLEVQWSGGRMLREYTLFLDPPTFASKAPVPMVSPQSVTSAPAPARPVPVEAYPDPSQLDTVETLKREAPVVAPQSLVVDSDTPPPMPPVEQDQAEVEPEAPATIVQEASGEPEIDSSRQTATVPEEPVTEAVSPPAESDPLPVSPNTEVEPIAESSPETQEAETELADTTRAEAAAQTAEEQAEADLVQQPATAEPAVEDVATEEPTVTEAVAREQRAPESADSELLPEPEETIHGPVQSGETLWGIASRYSSNSSYSINQAMLAIQRLNPDAFGGGNINSLKKGAILRMPTLREVGRLSKREAMVEAIRQEQNYLARRSGQPYEELPKIADSAGEQVALNEAEPSAIESGSNSDDGLLQLIPPSGDTAQDSGGNGSGETAVGAVSNLEVEEVLARTEEELANAQQENAYLNERIQELENQIAAQRTLGTVTDDAMAEMEQSLRDDRLNAPAAVENDADEPEPWFMSYRWYVAGGFVLLIGLVVWILRKRGGGGTSGPGSAPDPEKSLETVESIRSEAEEILQSLDDSDHPGDSGDLEEVGKPDEPKKSTSSSDNVIELDQFSEPADPSEEIREPVKPGNKAKIIPMGEEEVVELDSNDPEVQLDLARAYLSMGDKDAAREMLESVLESGNEVQVSEAKVMMDEL